MNLLSYFTNPSLYKTWSFTYSGQGVSLNKIYAQGHWTTRLGVKDRFKKIFSVMVGDKLKGVSISRFYLLVRYNSRHDCDNVVGMSKIFVDSLKGFVINEDGRKFYKGLFVVYDETLPKNTFEFNLIVPSNAD